MEEQQSLNASITKAMEYAKQDQIAVQSI